MVNRNKAIFDIARESGLSIIERVHNSELWDELVNEADYFPVAYSQHEIEYQLEYQKGNGIDIHDASLIINDGERPCAIWPLSLTTGTDTVNITTYGLPVFSPLFISELSAKQKKKIIKKCIIFINALCITFQIEKWESVEFFKNDLNAGLSFWHAGLLEKDAVVSIYHDLFIDLTLDFDEIKKHFRKSYKPLVTKGMKLWDVKLLEKDISEVWEEFRQLHFDAAGRKTRSDKSWEYNLAAIKAKRAFLIYLLDERERMIGGGYFTFTLDEGRYDVAAYDRSYFDQPVGHVVQDVAINELKRRGVRWYKIGQRPYKNDVTLPSEKEINIGKFKAGFSSHAFPVYRYKLSVEK
jgi:FemAB family protein